MAWCKHTSSTSLKLEAAARKKVKVSFAVRIGAVRKGSGMPVPGYTLGEVLGEGAFAQTRIGHHNDRPDQPVAVKSISRSHPRFDLEAIQKEIAVMQRINHPRCVNLLEVAHSLGRLLACASCQRLRGRSLSALLRCPPETFPALASPDAACRQVHEDKAAIHMVEELCAGGELFDRIMELGKFSEADAVHLIHQVVDGIQYLHSMGCIHRDLKPENLLMVGRTPGTAEYLQLKICDFGLSAMRDVDGTKEDFDKDLQKYMGTEEYIAPEVFITASSVAKQQAGEHYTGKIDVWAIGVIFYIMVTGRFPFMRKDHDSFYIVQQICKGTYDKECMERLSEDSKYFIDACLTINPDQRPTPFELMDLAIFKNDQLPTDDLHCLGTHSQTLSLGLELNQY